MGSIWDSDKFEQQHLLHIPTRCGLPSVCNIRILVITGKRFKGDFSFGALNKELSKHERRIQYVLPDTLQAMWLDGGVFLYGFFTLLEKGKTGM